MIGIMIGVFIIGLLSGLWLTLKLVRYYIINNPEGFIDSIRKEHQYYLDSLDGGPEDIDDPDSMIVSWECRDAVWYLYDVSTKMFAGQGKSLDEAVEVVKSRFPNKEIVVQQVKEAL